MSVVENIIGAVIIIAVLLVIGVLMTTNLMSRLNPLMGPSVRNYEYDAHSTNWHAVMNAIEPETGESMHSLLATSLIQFSPDIDFDGTIINVPQKLEVILDLVYGQDKYYFEAYPQIGTIYFSFILDGSGSFADERETVRNALRGIHDSIIAEQTDIDNFDLKFHIIILEGDANIGAIFTDPDTNPLTTLDGIEYDVFQIHKAQLDATNVPHPSIQFDNSGENEKVMYKSDWVSGIKYAQQAYEDVMINRGYFDFHFIFPISDEPATSAFPTTCFSRDTGRWLMCALCAVETGGVCNDRGDEQIDYLLGLPQFQPGNKVQIWPLSTIQCNYELTYDPIWNTYTADMSYAHGGQTPAQANKDYWCEFTECPGCTYNSGDGSVCFHPECKDTTLNQMQRLADATQNNPSGGQIIDVTAINSLASTIGDIANTVINDAQITIGDPTIKTNTNINKYVINKKLHLRAGKTTDIKLYVIQ